jgi:hypothetical protein
MINNSFNLDAKNFALLDLNSWQNLENGLEQALNFLQQNAANADFLVSAEKVFAKDCDLHTLEIIRNK